VRKLKEKKKKKKKKNPCINHERVEPKFACKIAFFSLCKLSRNDFVRYNSETETSIDEINLPDENDEPLDLGGE